MVFATTGGSGARYLLLFLSMRVKTAPIKVAMLPKIISGRIAPPKIFPRRHPINKPGIAAGVKTGRIVRAYAKRICTSPNAREAPRTVSTT